jgi:hypothetical protein
MHVPNFSQSGLPQGVGAFGFFNYVIFDIAPTPNTNTDLLSFYTS